MTNVLLAYSGSLDTTICLHWLASVKGFKVHTFSANLGQFEELPLLAEKAISLGATASHITDLRERFVKEFIYPCIRANAVYEEGYYLFSALSRPLIVEELIKIARDEACEFIAHGSRGIGNDYIRFENCVKALAPELKIITPLIELGLKGFNDDLKYVSDNNIKVEGIKKAIYNVEQNLWGSNIQLREFSLWDEPPREAYLLTVPVLETLDKVTQLELGFEGGLPKTLNAEEIPPLKLIDTLSKIGGRNGIGRYDIVESRLTGVKTREIYEAPAATIIYSAHKALEAITLDRDTLHYKDTFSKKYAELIYEGKWFTALRQGIDSFFQSIQEKVTGTVKLNLYKGKITVSGIKSPFSLIKT
jgi:argininosuccinate synthase